MITIFQKVNMKIFVVLFILIQISLGANQARKRGELCTRDIECGHHFLNCFKGPSGLGTCQTPWDFRQQCRNDNDCAHGFQCRTIQCKAKFQRDYDPDWFIRISRYCRLRDLGRNSGGGQRWTGPHGTGFDAFIQWFVDNCN